MRYLITLTLLLFFACSEKREFKINTWVPYDEAALIAENADHLSERMRYKYIQSRVSDKNELWNIIAPQLKGFDSVQYENYKSLIIGKNIYDLQKNIKEGKLSYKILSQWYLYRIVLFENDSLTALNNIVSINPDAVAQAIKLDEGRLGDEHLIYGMPILLKDNINTDNMPTTAGSVAFMDNHTDDAFITNKLKENGAIILGKTNLSEWANFLCDGCPNGYSATGGQTLNPYGPRKFDTGGSSSGSASAIAANYAVAAIGTETSGSILSPSSQQSLVGLKPTVGLLSRGGIVPISSTLDTPGPMTRNVSDNAILLSAMLGNDPKDPISMSSPSEVNYVSDFKDFDPKELRLGAIKGFMDDSLYSQAIEHLRNLGLEIIEIEPSFYPLEGFLSLLNADMLKDMAAYINEYASDSLPVKDMNDLVAYNNQDSLSRIPYGQARFLGVVNEKISNDSLEILKADLMDKGRKFFSEPMKKYDLDGILSINNWTAGYAAVAHYPCLTVPMGYEKGEPKGLTFVAGPFEELSLLKWAYLYENNTKIRREPIIEP